MCDPLRNVQILRLASNGDTLEERRDFDDTREATAYCAALAIEDAPMVQQLAQRIAGGARSLHEALRLAHDWIVANVGYVDDDECESFQSPLYTLQRGKGDCDDHATLGAALAVALGCFFALVDINGTPDEPEHLGLLVATPDAIAEADLRHTTMVPHPATELPAYGAYVVTLPIDAWSMLRTFVVPPGWHWSETTIAARFDEHPSDALARLGVRDRQDLV